MVRQQRPALEKLDKSVEKQENRRNRWRLPE